MARLYTKKVWLDDQTKLNAKNLNHIEKGIEAVADAVDAVENQLETFKDKVVIGEFNDNKENTLLEVGNGTSGSPSNAFEVYKDGTVKVGGRTLTIGDTEITEEQLQQLLTLLQGQPHN